MRGLVKLVCKYPWLTIIVSLSVVSFFVGQIPKLELEPSLKAMMPQDYPTLVIANEVERLFGGAEIAILTLTSDDLFSERVLKKVKRITDRLEANPDIRRVIGIFTAVRIRGETDELIVERFVEEIPSSRLLLDRLKEDLLSDEMLRGQVVSVDGKSTAFVCQVRRDVSDEVVRKALEQIREEEGGGESIRITGLPMMRAYMSIYMRRDLRIFFATGMCLMILLLYSAFQSLRGVFLPLTVVAMSLACTLGLMALLSIKLTIMGIVIPVILIAVANDYGIHLVARYYEDVRRMGPEAARPEILLSALSHVSRPILLAGLTTVAGFLTLLSHLIPPAKELGYLSAFGILVAFLFTLTFIPAFLALLKVPRVLQDPKRVLFMDRLFQLLARWIHRHLRLLVVFFAVLILASAIFIPRVKVDTSPIHQFDPNDRLVKDARFINDTFGGTVNLNILIRGDLKDPVLLGDMEILSAYLKAQPETNHPLSLVEYLKRINQAMNHNEPAFYRIPKSREAVAQYLLLFSMSGEDEALDSLVDYEYETAQIITRMDVEGSADVKRVVQKTKGFIEQNLQEPDRFQVTGFAPILAELNDFVTEGQTKALTLSLFLVLIITALAFRSLIAGFLCMVPVGFALVMVFGFMGAFGIRLDATTVLLSSIMIGVGIDYSVHFLWRYRTEIRARRNATDAFFATLTTTGRGIIYNALSVIAGFSVLLASNFQPVSFLGGLVLLSVFSCLYGAFTILPFLLQVIRPGFLLRVEKKEEVPSS